MQCKIGILCLLLCLSIACVPGENERSSVDTDRGEQALVYIGTYTRGASEGIYIYRIDLETGGLVPVGVQSGITNPSFLTIHPNHRNLYSVAEVGEFADMESGGVTAFSIDAQTGLLTQLNQKPSMGKGPCYVSVDKTGQYVLVANYGGGSVAVLPIQEDGILGAPTCSIQHEGASVDPSRQQKP